MANVVLSDELLELYWRLYRNFIKPEKNQQKQSCEQKQGFVQKEFTMLTKLLHYMQPFYTNQAQLLRCKIMMTYDNALYSQIISGGTIPCMKLVKDDTNNSIDHVDIENVDTQLMRLAETSKLKMLFTAHSETKFTDRYIIYNILKSQYSHFNYCRSFPSVKSCPITSDRSDAIAHIKAILQNAEKVTIADPYFISDSPSITRDHQRQENIRLLTDILPNFNVRLDIIVQNNTAQELISEFKNLLKESGFKNNTVKKDRFHDRYIEAGGVKIHLSSGCYYLRNLDQEFTYMLEIL